MTDATDRPLLGILFVIIFCAVIALADALAKLLGATVALLLLVASRFLIQAIILAPLTRLRDLAALRDPVTLRRAILRAALHVAGIYAMYRALLVLPLADAVAIAFIMPFILLLLGHFFLGEEVGRLRFAACGVGFGGTILIIQPNFVAVGWEVLWPVLVAFIFALFMVISRDVTRKVPPIALQCVSGAMASVVLVPLALLAPISFDLPAETWGLIAVMGVVGAGAHLAMTYSLKFAPASTLAPLQYLEIPFATLMGWLFFQDLPNGLATLGICITVGAGLFMIQRERATARRLAAQVAPPIP